MNAKLKDNLTGLACCALPYLVVAVGLIPNAYADTYNIENYYAAPVEASPADAYQKYMSTQPRITAQQYMESRQRVEVRERNSMRGKLLGMAIGVGVSGKHDRAAGAALGGLLGGMVSGAWRM